MNAFLCTLMLAALCSSAAEADTITISFDQPVQTGAPGETLAFFGSIFNDTPNTVFLNGDDLNLNDPDLSANDLFFTTVPPSLAPQGQPGDSSGDIELFDLMLGSSPLDPTAVLSGSYTLVGGVDGDAQDNLGSANVNLVGAASLNAAAPEPSSLCLLLGGLLASVAIALRRYRNIIAGIVIAGTITSAANAQTKAPDLILRNGRIFTGDSAHAWVEAVSIQNDRILAVGTDEDITATTGEWIYASVGVFVIRHPLEARAAIDGTGAGHPVILDSWWGHGVILNSQRLARLNIGDSVPVSARRAL